MTATLCPATHRRWEVFMLVCPDPPPATVVLDPHDDLVHTRAALATQDLAAGRITVYPSSATCGTP
jgi:hypothetical protein